MRTQAIPNLKEVYRDETLGVCGVHLCAEKFIIHSQLFGTIDRRKLERAQEVNVLIDETFREKGVKVLHTWAINDEQYRYNIFMGYKPNGNEVFVEGYDGTVYEFEKEL